MAWTGIHCYNLLKLENNWIIPSWKFQILFSEIAKKKPKKPQTFWEETAFSLVCSFDQDSYPVGHFPMKRSSVMFKDLNKEERGNFFLDFFKVKGFPSQMLKQVVSWYKLECLHWNTRISWLRKETSTVKHI